MGTREINIGAQGFDEIRENGNFYIDKTSFIREWWEDTSTVTLITRPRRFGKTLNMRMLECFFSNRYAGRSDLFEGLDIWKDEKYQKLQGTFPVIFISFANVKEQTFSSAKEAVVRTVAELFQGYKDLWADDSPEMAKRYSFMDIGPDVSDVEITRSLHDLSDYLFFRYKKKALIILDEYDTPLQEAFINGYWKEMSDFMRSLFNSTFKTNPSMQRAVMTGITRVSRESIFSDLNNPNVVTTTSTQYETAFGFTEDEVFRSLEEYGLGDEKENVRKWYDGFTFGRTSNIYNPWSIINFLKQKRFAPYWANTSSNSLIGHELQKSDIITKDQMLQLMNGGTIRTKLDEQVVFSQLNFSAEALWSLFLSSGYLRIVSVQFDGRRDRYTLAITNLEVEIMFEDLIGDWFSDVRVEYGEFVQSLIAGDVAGIRQCLGDVLLNKASFFDTKKERSENRKPESFYHGLVLGMVAQEQEYSIQSNGESGIGRYDIMMIPRRGERSALPAVIMEFKLFDPDKEDTLEDTARRALRQVEDRNYAARLLDQGFRGEEILEYGFGFSGKKVAVEMKI